MGDGGTNLITVPADKANCILMETCEGANLSLKAGEQEREREFILKVCGSYKVEEVLKKNRKNEVETDL